MNSQTPQPIEGASQRESGDRVPSHENDYKNLSAMIQRVRNLLKLFSNHDDNKKLFISHGEKIVNAVGECMTKKKPEVTKAKGLLRGFRNVYANLFPFSAKDAAASIVYFEVLRKIEENKEYGEMLKPFIRQLREF